MTITDQHFLLPILCAGAAKETVSLRGPASAWEVKGTEEPQVNK